MTCNRLGVIGRIFDISSPTLTAGEEVSLATQLVYKGSSDPYAIVGFVGATGQFAAQEDYQGPIAASGYLESADRGVLRFDMDAATSALLQLGDEQDFQVRLLDANGLRITRYLGLLNVAEPLF